MRSNVHHQLNNLGEALTDCNKAAKINSKDVRIYAMRNEIQLKLGKLDKAILDIEEYLKLGGGTKYRNQAEMQELVRALKKLAENALLATQNKLEAAKEMIEEKQYRLARMLLDLLMHDELAMTLLNELDNLEQSQPRKSPIIGLLEDWVDDNPIFYESKEIMSRDATSYLRHGYSGQVAQAVFDQLRRNGEFSDLILTRIYIPGANLSETKIISSNLSRSIMSDVNFSRSNLTGSNFMGANLSNANFTGADLNNTVLERSDLSGADLRGANLHYAHLKGAILEDALFDENTILPDGTTWTVNSSLSSFTLMINDPDSY